MRKKRIRATIQLPHPVRDEDSAALKLVAAWMEHDQAWEQWAASQPYDGILGTLPDWMGPEIQAEFLRVRNNLLRSNYAGIKVTPPLVRSWLEVFCRLGEDETQEVSSDPVIQHFLPQVEQLAHWRWIHSQGQAVAQVQISGPDLVEGAAIGKKHRLKQQEIAKKSRATPFDVVFEQLLNPIYGEWKNKELWEALIALSDDRGVLIEEKAPPLRLRWEDDETGKRGTLLYSSFAAKLAVLRAKHGKLKRGRRKS